MTAHSAVLPNSIVLLLLLLHMLTTRVHARSKSWEGAKGVVPCAAQQHPRCLDWCAVSSASVHCGHCDCEACGFCIETAGVDANPSLTPIHPCDGWCSREFASVHCPQAPCSGCSYCFASNPLAPSAATGITSAAMVPTTPAGPCPAQCDAQGLPAYVRCQLKSCAGAQSHTLERAHKRLSQTHFVSAVCRCLSTPSPRASSWTRSWTCLTDHHRALTLTPLSGYCSLAALRLVLSDSPTASTSLSPISRRARRLAACAMCAHPDQVAAEYGYGHTGTPSGTPSSSPISSVSSSVSSSGPVPGLGPGNSQQPSQQRTSAQTSALAPDPLVSSESSTSASTSAQRTASHVLPPVEAQVSGRGDRSRIYVCAPLTPLPPPIPLCICLTDFACAICLCLACAPCVCARVWASVPGDLHDGRCVRTQAT